jgi:uracil-DNA glycosylase family 4
VSPKTQASAGAEELTELAREAAWCELCPQLVESRTQVVFGSGPADAALMLVGEAPGASEDREGLPFVGASGRLLDTLLDGIGLSREEVFIANVLKCRPPENRDPKPEEVANCSPWLERQLGIVNPAVVVTLGNFATRLLRGDPAPIGKVRGRPEIVSVGSRRVRLFPVFHPAAALYRRPNLEVLETDFAEIPGLLALGPPEQLPPVTGGVADGGAGKDGSGNTGGEAANAGGGESGTAPGEPSAGSGGSGDDSQLGLF